MTDELNLAPLNFQSRARSETLEMRRMKLAEQLGEGNTALIGESWKRESGDWLSDSLMEG